MEFAYFSAKTKPGYGGSHLYPAFGRLTKEDCHEFRAILGYIVPG